VSDPYLISGGISIYGASNAPTPKDSLFALNDVPVAYGPFSGPDVTSRIYPTGRSND